MSGLIPPRTSIGSSSPSVTPMEPFAEGKIDAFLGFPPEPQELRARKIGHVVVNSAAIDPGRSTSAACWPATRTSCVSTRSRPSACCAPFSRLRICAQRSGAGGAADGRSRIHRRYDYALQTLNDCLTTSGASTIPRTRPVLRPTAAGGRHDQSARRRSSPTARTGAFCTNSSAN